MPDVKGLPTGTSGEPGNGAEGTALSSGSARLRGAVKTSPVDVRNTFGSGIQMAPPFSALPVMSSISG